MYYYIMVHNGEHQYVHIEIDISSQEAVYEQIVRQIEQGVQQEILPVGTALPSIRQLAHDLSLNHNTVARAYKILENSRIIRTAGRKGTVIHGDAPLHIDNRNNQDAIYMMSELVDALSKMGLSIEQMKSMFRTAIGAKPKKR